MTRETEEARRLAADPTTDWATLYELAQTNPEVHAVLAANPATYPDLLAWLGSLGKPEVDEALALRDAPSAAASDAGAAEWPDQTGVAPPVVAPTMAVPVTPPVVAPPVAAPETQVIAPAQQAETPPAYAPATDATATAGAPVTVERISVTETFGRPARTVEPPQPLPPVGQSPFAQPPVGRPVRPTEPTEPADKRRLPLIAVLAVVGVLAVAGIVWLLGRGGDDPTATATPPATVSPTTAPPTTPAPTTPAPTTDAEAALEEATAALAGTAGSTTCTDPGTDAAALAGYAIARLAVGSWGEDATRTVGDAIALVQSRCNAGYAVQVADGAGAQSPDIAAQLAGREWVVPVLPAPTDAADLTSFASPTGNIACALEEDRVRCSIAQYSFGPPETCPDPAAPVTALIDSAGARADCGAGPVAGGPALSYGTSARHSHFACTSAQDGMTCWDTWTGARLKLARAALDVQGPVLGSAG